MARIIEAAQEALPEIDGILHRFKGWRLANAPDALGCLPVETTAEGIYALAASQRVRALLEDQAIFLLS